MTLDAARHVAVVGGGISGLAAAWFLHRDAPQTRVTVLEAGDRVGGKLRLDEVGGQPLDQGAESLLLRRPEAVALAQAAGLALTEARTTAAAVWSRGRLVPLPAGTVMGVPTRLRSLAASGLLRPAETARASLDRWLPGAAPDDDVAIGRFVAARLGPAVRDRLVEPLLGGVYAGRADELSLAATVPALWAQLSSHRSLVAAARASTATGRPAGPVFGAPAGGVGLLPDAVAASAGASVRTRATVRGIRRTDTGFELSLGPADGTELLAADAVVVAAPPPAAARLLRELAPVAAAELAGVPMASMAIVSLAYPAHTVPALPWSGFLVPPVEGRAVKAVTFSGRKWAWHGERQPELELLRASLGRIGEESLLQREDSELVDLVTDDLAATMGIRHSPVDARVQRWGGGLPQYLVGHRGRVERIRDSVARVPGLAVCGAAYDGVGIPACIATAEQATASLLRQWSGE